MNEEIAKQKRQVFRNNNKVVLVRPCGIDDGVIQVSETAKEGLINSFDEMNLNPLFFIPASGSGSRMFQFLFEFLENGIETEEVNSFFSSLEDFPFFKALENTCAIESLDKKQIAAMLIDEEELNLGGLPKGLIPFHAEEGKLYTAFQDHVRQIKTMICGRPRIEFSTQEEYKDLIKSNIDLLNFTDLECSYSSQSKDTDAFCFTSNQELCEVDGLPLRRPAGHGALLENLNAIDSDLIVIKNIDNVQHYSKSSSTINELKMLTSLLVRFKKDLKRLSLNFSTKELKELNSTYQFLSENDIESMTSSKLQLIISRPSRVCGMVKNEGEPGGGPFWIKDDSGNTKQIVEKSQVDSSVSQKLIMDTSAYFNPVVMVISKTDALGNKLNLHEFIDEEKCLIVRKSHRGEDVLYRELPGLWNGSMSNWNTIFIEIPSTVFSPVKTVHDLLRTEHKA